METHDFFFLNLEYIKKVFMLTLNVFSDYLIKQYLANGNATVLEKRTLSQAEKTQL